MFIRHYILFVLLGAFYSSFNMEIVLETATVMFSSMQVAYGAKCNGNIGLSSCRWGNNLSSLMKSIILSLHIYTEII